MSSLIKVHPSIMSCLEVEDERYGPPLFASLATGSKEAVQTFLEAHAAKQSPGNRLHKLCSQYQQAKGRKGNLGRSFKFSKQRTVPSYLAELGEEIIFAFVLETGKFDVDSKDKDGRTPLSRAAEKAHETIVKLLLETGKVDADSKDRGGRTPLSRAAEGGNEAVVNLLLEMGKVDVDSKDKGNWTALSWAIEEGYKAIVELLLKAGAEVNHEYNWPWDWNDPWHTPLSRASERGNEDIVKLLLEMGKVDVNWKDKDGRTALSRAMEGGHEAVVKLLGKGADVNA